MCEAGTRKLVDDQQAPRRRVPLWAIRTATAWLPVRRSQTAAEIDRFLFHLWAFGWRVKLCGARRGHRFVETGETTSHRTNPGVVFRVSKCSRCGLRMNERLAADGSPVPLPEGYRHSRHENGV
jgi:hypothetical protein